MSRVEIVKEVAKDIARGDRYALTKICENYPRHEVRKFYPFLKKSSKKFIRRYYQRKNREANKKNQITEPKP